MILHRRGCTTPTILQYVNSSHRQFTRHFSRDIEVLSIETSCDDTSVAIAKCVRHEPGVSLEVEFHETVTSNNTAYSGIHPLVALHSHQASLAALVQKALSHRRSTWKPDLVCATRGPGMRGNLSVGLDTAKGLALGFNVPLIGVHHMQAHALTPRLISAKRNAGNNVLPLEPQFPFLTVLVSGGHTMLLNSTGLTEHETLAETHDIAIGDFLDKAARAILPSERLKAPYGKALEDFAFPNGQIDYKYSPPKKRQDEMQERQTRWNWAFAPPFADSKSGAKSPRRMIYSFGGLHSTVERFMTRCVDSNGHLIPGSTRLPEEVSIEERQEMASEVQRIAFEHLASRILLHLSSQSQSAVQKINTIVVSGGVAANKFLRHVLRTTLDVRGYNHVELNLPPVSLCTDNALMIAWAGIEMYCAGYASSFDVLPIRKWSMDPNAEDGGILGAGGWTRRKGETFKLV